MTKLVEVLDALPGSGKTHAIIKYMSEHQDKKWLYISPMLEETEERVPISAQELGMNFFVPYEDQIYSKSETCLQAMQRGLNICCTHNLMYLFTKKHLDMIEKQGYCVVSDEELNLINGYNLKKEDFDFLVKNNIISILEDGKVEFLDEDMGTGARYGDVKAKADLGMLYAAKRSDRMLITQLSPKIIDCSERFILLTYNYKNSLMQVFLDMHQYEFKYFDEVQLWKTDEEIKESLRQRIQIIESPQIKKVQNNYSLSKSWWVNASKEDRLQVSRCIRSVWRNSGVDRDDMFYTIPKDYCSKDKGFETKFISSEPRTDSEGNVLDYTRTFIACNARSTNKYSNKRLAIHAYNLFPNQAVKAFLQGNGMYCDDDVYSINMMIQWLFRGCIRKKEGTLQVAFLSKRMSILFKEWLINKSDTVVRNQNVPNMAVSD